MKIMSGAVTMVLLFGGSFARVAEPAPVPGDWPRFPESIESGMIGEGAAITSQMSSPGVFVVSQSSESYGARGQWVPYNPLPYAAPSTLQDPSDYKELEKASRALVDRNLAEAFRMFEGRPQTRGPAPSPFVMMHNLLAKAGQTILARAWLDQAVLQTPDDPEPWVIIGERALTDNRLPEVELDFMKAKQLLSDYKDRGRKNYIELRMLSGMAELAARRRRWTEAQAAIEEYLKKSPEDVEAMQRLARVMFWQKMPEFRKKAYDILVKANEIDKRNAEKNHTAEKLLPAAAILAQFYDECQRSIDEHYRECKEAKHWFSYALKMSPNDLNLRATVGVWALENNEMEMSKPQAKEALRIEMEDMNHTFENQKYHHSIVGRMLNGEIALWHRNWTKAERYFVDVVVERPTNFEALNGLAFAVVEQDDRLSNGWAGEYLIFEYLRDHPNDSAALTTAAWVRFRRGELPLAAEAIKKAIKAAGLDLKSMDAEHCDPNEAANLVVSGIGKRPNYAGLPLSVKLRDLEIQCVMAHVLEAQGAKQPAKAILKAILDDGQPFLMKPQAQALYEKVKDAKEP